MSCDIFSFTYGPFIFHQVGEGGAGGIWGGGGMKKMALKGESE